MHQRNNEERRLIPTWKQRAGWNRMSGRVGQRNERPNSYVTSGLWYGQLTTAVPSLRETWLTTCSGFADTIAFVSTTTKIDSGIGSFFIVADARDCLSGAMVWGAHGPASREIVTRRRMRRIRSATLFFSQCPPHSGRLRSNAQRAVPVQGVGMSRIAGSAQTPLSYSQTPGLPSLCSAIGFRRIENGRLWRAPLIRSAWKRNGYLVSCGGWVLPLLWHSYGRSPLSCLKRLMVVPIQLTPASHMGSGSGWQSGKCLKPIKPWSARWICGRSQRTTTVEFAFW